MIKLTYKTSRRTSISTLSIIAVVVSSTTAMSVLKIPHCRDGSCLDARGSSTRRKFAVNFYEVPSVASNIALRVSALEHRKSLDHVNADWRREFGK